MAQIEKKDLISEEAISAPLQLAANIDKAVQSIADLIKKGKQANVNLDQAKDIKTLSKETDNYTTRQKELEKVEKRIQTVQAKNNKEYIERQAELKRAQRNLRNLINEEERAGGEYRRQSQRLRDLKNRYKDKMLIEKQSTDETRAMKQEIDELDKELSDLDKSVQDTYREVGNYKDNITEALEETDVFGVNIGGLGKKLAGMLNPIGLVTAAIGAIGGAYLSTARGQKDVERSASRLMSTYRRLGNTIADLGDEGFLDLTDSMGNQIGFLEALTRQVTKLVGGYAALADQDISQYFQNIINNLQTQEQIANKMNKELLAEAEIRRQIRDDDRKSMPERIKANEQLLGFLTKRRDAQIEIFRKQEEAFRMNLGRQLSSAELERIKNLETLEEKQDAILQNDRISNDLKSEYAGIIAEIADIEEDYQGQKSEQLANNLALEREYQANVIELTKARLQEQIILAKEGSEEEFNARLKLIDEQEQLELQSAGENQNRINIAVQNALNARLELYKEFQSKIKGLPSIEPMGIGRDMGVDFTDEEKRLKEFGENFRETQKRTQQNVLSDWDRFTSKFSEIVAKVGFILRSTFGEALNIVRDNLQMQLDFVNNKLDNLEERKEYELNLAGRNAEEREEIEREFLQKQKEIEKERIELQRKKAVTQKALAITNAIISTAQAVAQALTLGPILGPIVAGIIGSLGAAQVAVIASQPIPQFAKGTESSPEGLAVVNEEGGELMEHNGKYSMVDSDGAALTYLKKGTKIHTAAETQEILASGVSGGISMQYEKKTEMYNTGLIINGLKDINRSIKKQKQVHINTTRQGVDALLKNGHNYHKLINSDFK